MNWNLPAPPGFQALRPDLPLTQYTRHMPHWRQDGATYFVTFRLADSLPHAKLRELEMFKEQWKKQLESTRRTEQCSGSPDLSQNTRTEHRSVLRSEETFARQVMLQVEKWLDQGIGACWLRHRPMRDIVSNALHHFDGSQYELGSYVIMPNHVHVIIRPLQPEDYPLEKILQSRKARSSSQINIALGRVGTLWQDESFDRIIRDEEHLWRCLQYIGSNPRRAGLLESQWTRWVPPLWVKCGWTFADW